MRVYAYFALQSVVACVNCQVVVGPTFGVQHIDFFKVNNADVYRAEYEISVSPAYGVAWMKKIDSHGALHLSVCMDELQINYTARRTALNSSFSNESRHKLSRIRLRGNYMRDLGFIGKGHLYLGPGIGISGIHVLASEGHGFYTAIVERKDSTGTVIYSGPGSVTWRHNGRNPDSFFPIYGLVDFQFLIHYPIGKRWKFGLNIQSELSITPWIRDTQIRFTSNYTIASGISVFYAINLNSVE